MLLDAVVIVLREVIEAALIISVLLVSNQLHNESRRWIVPAIGSGVLLSVLLATQIGAISESFEGAGQEYVHCLLITLIVLCLLLRIAEMLFERIRHALRRYSALILGLAVALAISREGEEIFVYGYAFASRAQSQFHVVLGTAIGAGIGMSIGVLCYYTLMFFRGRRLLPAIISVLTLIAAGMITQAVTNLMQAGAIVSEAPLWNSTWLIDEASLAGQLLYALFGYESTPTLFQAVAYAVIIAAVIFMALAARFSTKRR